MASCAGNCVGVAVAPTVPCVRSHGGGRNGHVRVLVTQMVPVSGKAVWGRNGNVWGIGGVSSPLVSNVRSSTWQRLIANASQEAGTSTLVVQEVEFIWKGPGSEVLLSGDFLNWESQLQLMKGPEGWFVVKQKLAPGTYKYKFIVDGVWQHSPDCPSVPDNNGGFNNEITVTEKAISQVPAKDALGRDMNAAEDSIKSTTSEGSTDAATSPKPKVAASKKAAPSDAAEANPSVAASPPKPKAAAAGGKKAAKAVAKPLLETMVEDVIPQLTTFFKKEEGVSDVDLVFADNQLEGGYVRNGTQYNFWAFFPDGELEGSRGFSLTSHGSPPSTIEPFLIDEKKFNGDLIVLWITKRLFAQKFLSTN